LSDAAALPLGPAENLVGRQEDVELIRSFLTRAAAEGKALTIITRLDHYCDEATFVDWEQTARVGFQEADDLVPGVPVEVAGRLAGQPGVALTHPAIVRASSVVAAGG
jgi:hypothetical protein